MVPRAIFVLLVLVNLHVIHAKRKKQKPNVIFILTDDHGYRDIGYHGSLFETPVLDQMADEGVKLENYYVQPMCTPTRSQLMTGRYQIRTGLQHFALVPWAPSCLPLDEVTIADKMREAGYSTHMVGKWHLGHYLVDCLPLSRGFDSFLGSYLYGGTHFNHTGPYGGYDFHRGFDPAPEYFGIYSTDAFTDETIDIINNKDEDKPLFLYLAYQAPHDPLEVPEEYKEPLRGIFTTDENRLTYAAMVTCLDASVGRIVDALKANGEYENTVIIFSSDNGGNVDESGINWPYRGQKATLFEGGSKAIGFVHSPLLHNKVIGTINDELIHVSDWYPTIIEGIAGWYTDGPGTNPIDGVNQWKNIRYGSCSNRYGLLHNIDPLTVLPTGGRDWVADLTPFNISISAAIRHRDWKLITGNNGQEGWHAPPDSGIDSITPPAATEQIVWLYNIKKDPLEINDLSEQNRKVVEFLLNRLYEYYQESVPVFFPDLQFQQANPCQNGNNCIWGPWTPV